MIDSQKQFLVNEIEKTVKDKNNWIAKYGKNDEDVKTFDLLLENLNKQLINLK